MIRKTCRFGHSKLIQHQERIKVPELDIRSAPQSYLTKCCEVRASEWTYLPPADAPAYTSTDSL